MTREIIDVHSHVYLPRYMEILKSRTVAPRIFELNGEFRLIILPGEDLDPSTKQGRPIGKEYFDPETKLEFMKVHGITKSVLSLGNPWLDFLDDKEAAPLAKALNADLQEYCEKFPEQFYGFGVLPTASPQECVLELENISKLDKLRGAIVNIA
jgi:aminocarboxymuconate-semialdehyde decarboxylase